MHDDTLKSAVAESGSRGNRARFNQILGIRLYALRSRDFQRDSAKRNFLQRVMVTLTDFAKDAGDWRLWSKFGWHDLLSRYRRSWIGPLWLMFTAIIFISALSLVYSSLFNMPLATYVPFVAIGVACWGYISAVCSEGVGVFVEAEPYIRNVRGKLFIYVLRVVWRNVLVFLHYFLVAFVVVVILGNPSVRLLPLATFGLFLLLIQALWVVPLLGVLGTRFRDFQPIIANVLTVGLFVTPVFWFPSSLGARRWIADINPLSGLITIVRDPLLGSAPSPITYLYVAVLTFVGFCLAIIFYTRYHKRLIYWL
ncbi:ABC transporter permease [Candidatus Darwinibacter acetoxidans]